MKLPTKTPLFLLATMATCHAAAVLTTSESNFSTNQSVGLASQTWAGSISSTDLVQTGAPTFANRSYSATPHSAFGGATSDGVHDGGTGDANTSNCTFWVVGNLPMTITFDLNVATNTLGYDITSVDVFQGWTSSSGMQANQNYTIAVSTVGSAGYTDLITVNYNPFGTANDSHHYTHTQVTENSSGILASGVDSVRLTFLTPASSGGSDPGIVINEIDVQGVATVPEPSSAALLGLAGFGILLRRKR
ncbi:MAG: PEP-CTERM sorting domain-containing protein [Akkermansiaceae bacterium]|nr:PEP-CTERM sorting domain-containing protein [Akkermansiaceae bacterium]